MNPFSLSVMDTSGCLQNVPRARVSARNQLLAARGRHCSHLFVSGAPTCQVLARAPLRVYPDRRARVLGPLKWNDLHAGALVLAAHFYTNRLVWRPQPARSVACAYSSCLTEAPGTIGHLPAIMGAQESGGAGAAQLDLNLLMISIEPCARLVLSGQPISLDASERAPRYRASLSINIYIYVLGPPRVRPFVCLSNDPDGAHQRPVIESYVRLSIGKIYLSQQQRHSRLSAHRDPLGQISISTSLQLGARSVIASSAKICPFWSSRRPQWSRLGRP